MTLEDEIIDTIFEKTELSYITTRWDVRYQLFRIPLDKQFAWIVMEVDEFLTPRLLDPNIKMQALTSPSPLTRDRARILLNEIEFNVALYRARNGLKWN